MICCPHDIRTDEAKRLGLDGKNGIAIIDFSDRVEARQVGPICGIAIESPNTVVASQVDHQCCRFSGALQPLDVELSQQESQHPEGSSFQQQSHNSSIEQKES